ncbi:MAG: alginate export family protein [Candidatus Kapabacteria bacterium]|nr:alginate export family protein [Candidatus Kapabacteria bacterium]
MNKLIRLKSLIILAFLHVIAINCFADDISSQTYDFHLKGNFIWRSELDARDFSTNTYPLTSSVFRVAAGVEKTVWDNFTFCTIAQDNWQAGDSGRSNLHIQQAYIDISYLLRTNISFKVGRFEQKYGLGNFVSSSDWMINPNYFDGFILNYKHEKYFIDAFLFDQHYANKYTEIPVPNDYFRPALASNDASMLGLWYGHDDFEGNLTNAFITYEYDLSKNSGNKPKLQRLSCGADYLMKIDDFSLQTNLTLQIGQSSRLINNLPLSAYDAGLSAQYNYWYFKFIAGAEIMSGNKVTDSSADHAFIAVYRDKHLFNGKMGYFASQANIEYLGLQDYYFSLRIEPLGSKVTGYIDLHQFLAYKPLTLSSGGLSNIFGQELDIAVKYNFSQDAKLELGSSVFNPKCTMKELWKDCAGKIRADVSYWFYIAMSYKF